MRVTRRSWDAYSRRQRAQRRKARAEMLDWLEDEFDGDMDGLSRRALRTAIRNGAASAELACEFYDQVSRGRAPKAAPVVVADEGRIMAQVEKAVPLVALGDRDGFAERCASAVAGEVKRSASATMMRNASRDGAEFAWIPQGDETCAFCMTVASNGWQRAKKSTAMGDHAEHIHDNCDCEFAIRFGGDEGVAGYDPDAYYEQYRSADGMSSRDKINSMRRDLYAERRDVINAQHRERYAALHPKEGE